MNAKMNFFVALAKRFASENPKFWKIFSTVGFTAFGIITIVLFANEYELVTIPDNWLHALERIDAFFLGVGMTAQGGTTNPTLMDDTTKDKVVEHVMEKKLDDNTTQNKSNPSEN